MRKMEDLLEKTSRTFAMSIPLLEETLHQEVGLAYLLFRILDTFEDAESWSPLQRIQALQEFTTRLHTQTTQEQWQASTKRWLQQPPCEHEGYKQLLSEIPWVIQTLSTFRQEARHILLYHTSRTSEGMVSFLKRMDSNGSLVLQDRPQLQEYCYIVAGIVGELLTDLFLLEDMNLAEFSAQEKQSLQRQAVAFGEVLQLVNILKDTMDDAKEGRSYVPHDLSKDELFALIHKDLAQATQYIHTLQDKGASRGVLAFTALPLLIAQETLQLLSSTGAGAKIGRSRVAALFLQMEADLEHGRRLL